MATMQVAIEDGPGGGTPPGRTRARRGWGRPLALGLAAGLALLSLGDHGVRGANVVQGIDPLDILNLQVKPNVLFVIDSSANMARTDDTTVFVGGDDPQSRFYAAKQAVREVIQANSARANFGIFDFSANLSQRAINPPASEPGAAFVYVTADAAGAATWGPFFTTTPLSFPGSTCAQLTSCSGGSCAACETETFQSFVDSGTDTLGRQHLESRVFHSGLLYTWNRGNSPGARLVSVDSFDCASVPPPAGLLGDDTATSNDGTEARPCFAVQHQGGDNSTRAVYYYSSPVYGNAPAGGASNEGSGECDGTTGECRVADIPACTAASNLSTLTDKLKLQLPLSASATQDPIGLTANSGNDVLGTQPNNAGGMQLGGPSRHIGLALSAAQNYFNTTVASNRPTQVNGLQANFVIVVTSGPDDDGTAASQAAAMFGQGSPNKIQTIVVAYNGRTNFDLASSGLNTIQSNGSGGARPVAYRAASAQELKQSLNFAFSEAIASGTFSTESSITESLYEYVARAGNYNPLDPTTRYRGRVPTLLQSSFDMPGFTGHLRAFQAAVGGACPTGTINRGNGSCEMWDAGLKLRNRVWSSLCPGAADADACASHTQVTSKTNVFTTFRGTSPVAPTFAPSGSGVLNRRIFTSPRNGVFPYNTAGFGTGFAPAAAQVPTPLWPPDDAVAPRDDITPGSLDVALGIATRMPDGTVVPLPFLQLQSEFGSCQGDPLPVACQATSPATVRQMRALREAREQILAFTAGAEVSQDANGFPLRTGVAGVPCADAACGDLVYDGRPWVLAESTLGVPAVVPPPLQARPLLHSAEYLLLRDGVRNPNTGLLASTSSTTAQGFGLRNPDITNFTDAVTPSPHTDLQPLMSVVYHAANDMLHAFRGGPCATNPTLGEYPNGNCGSITETGGEELWGFVPFDALPQLRERMRGQGRAPHTYMLAASVRFADVFVPGEFDITFTGGGTTATRTYEGQWRTMMLIGRGIAGKYYTALDITSPGMFSQSSGTTMPPILMWSRGNPDTVDGTVGGTVNRTAADYSDYLKMGETWSVPAITSVDPHYNNNKEFAIFSGSGYGPANDPTSVEGKTFYVLDALTGDVIHTATVPDASAAAPVRNALVANPSAYVAAQLAPGFVGNPAASQASLVYIGDLHGRMWKYITSSPSVGMVVLKNAGVNQPIASAAGLLNINSRPHVYFETGNDIRVSPNPSFQMWGVRDDLQDTSPFCDSGAAPGTLDAGIACAGTYAFPTVFAFNFDGPFDGFRGTAQPATAFNSSAATANGRVFFIGTKFTPGRLNNCVPRYDSALFAVGAQTGNGVYDFDNSAGEERSTLIAGQKINAIRGALGQIVLDTGAVGSNAPAPPPPPEPAALTVTGSSGQVFTSKMKASSSVCR